METGKPAGRHYGMDWLRIGAFQILILYHVGMAFVPWDFSVKVTPPIDWAVIPMFLTNPWRLSLLFVVSGFASAACSTGAPA
jgi:glucan biosynthesis protein C